MCRLSWNLGASTSWNPQGLFRPVTGLLCLLHLFFFNCKNISCQACDLFFTAVIKFVLRCCVSWCNWSVRTSQIVCSHRTCAGEAEVKIYSYNHTPVLSWHNATHVRWSYRLSHVSSGLMWRAIWLRGLWKQHPSQRRPQKSPWGIKQWLSPSKFL